LQGTKATKRKLIGQYTSKNGTKRMKKVFRFIGSFLFSMATGIVTTKLDTTPKPTRYRIALKKQQQRTDRV
jgi:hypothetical protein